MNNSVPALFYGSEVMRSLPENDFNVFYQVLRDTHPVSQLDNGAWLLSRYEDVYTALSKPALFSSVGLNTLMLPDWIKDDDAPDFPLLFQDPPEHTQLRKLFASYFSKRIDDTRMSRYSQIASIHIDAIEAGKPMEFLSQCARLYADSVFSDMTGADVDKETFALFHRWLKLQEIPPLEEDQAFIDELVSSSDKVEEKLNQILSANVNLQHKDDDNGCGSIMAIFKENESAIAQSGAQAEKLLTLFVLGGLEIVPYVLCQAIYNLAHNPELFQALKNDNTLLYPYLHEITRLYPSIHVFTRKTTTDVTISEVTIPAKSNVFLLAVSANRDPEQFAHADQIDLYRQKQNHLSFGVGVHQCLGKHFTLNTMAALMTAMLTRFSRFSCPPADELNDYVSYATHGFNEFPVTFFQ